MKTAIMGFGTIGTGVYEVLRTNRDVIARRVGEPIELAYILDIRDFTGTKFEKIAISDYRIIADDPEVTLVVETMGGVEPACTFVTAMLEAGKHVITSNKALVAEKGSQLLALAEEKDAAFLFEASVGGGIPIIRPLLQCLTGDVIEEICGIINGTTNYILSAMDQQGTSYDDALAEAQRQGYAERDPSADVEGWDACRKIAILTSLAAERQVDFETVPTEGITDITPVDFAYARQLDCTIKLLARSRQSEGTYALQVAPFFVRRSAPLASVSGVNNAIYVRGNMLGEAMFYGAGAGKLPTASAVVGDLVDAARHGGACDRIRWEAKPLQTAEPGRQTHLFFVRCKAGEEACRSAFGDIRLLVPEEEGETAFVTPAISQEAFARAAAPLGLIQRIRVRRERGDS